MAAVMFTGCCSDMKTTFVNELDTTIEPNYRTSGPENFRVVVGKIAPGEDETKCIKLGHLLPAQFTITIREATPDQLQHIVTIPEKFPSELFVTFFPDPDLGVMIKVVDQDGNELKKR